MTIRRLLLVGDFATLDELDKGSDGGGRDGCFAAKPSDVPTGAGPSPVIHSPDPLRANPP
ncbi:hypothetical protein [Pseudomonas sp. BP8]|uniref:hypothetical protein n=1 Tax=Pseudomonas sp. BP8 TaxID=2817864 RepID=UPI001AE8EDE4|nr:hypothetical protein [Pseudomonas sp. BP8]MBP2259602.1 hypothetical protein [Pseudomonas sp. BP8]HDS1733619.1 hypothetical protein [Pseudomonas putida]